MTRHTNTTLSCCTSTLGCVSVDYEEWHGLEGYTLKLHAGGVEITRDISCQRRDIPIEDCYDTEDEDEAEDLRKEVEDLARNEIETSLVATAEAVGAQSRAHAMVHAFLTDRGLVKDFVAFAHERGEIVCEPEKVDTNYVMLAAEIIRRIK